jgi:Mn2+/Fe2+ NRAMP family transporter
VRRPVGRSIHHRLAHRGRRFAARRASVIALAAVVGPGVLAGLSDDDPAGITTYSVLGADYGYRLLWVLALSTAALIVFHEIGVRTGVVTGKGLTRLVRERYGPRATTVALGALVVANLGTLCAEFAGVAAGAELLGDVRAVRNRPPTRSPRASTSPATSMTPSARRPSSTRPFSTAR